MRQGFTLFVGTAALVLCCTSIAEAVTCDWQQRTSKTCFPGKKWISERQIQFDSVPPCSVIDYRVNGFDYQTRVIDGVSYETHERLPDQKGRDLPIDITDCVVFATVEENRRSEKEPSPADSEPPSPNERANAGTTAKRVVWCHDLAADDPLAELCKQKDLSAPTNTAKPNPKIKPEDDFYNADRVRESKERKVQQERDDAEEHRKLRAAEEQLRRRQEAMKKKQPQETSLIEQERQRQLQEQRQQNANAWWKAVGTGLQTFGTYYAAPKKPQPIPQPSYKRGKVQTPSVIAPSPSTTTTTHTNCPGNAAADENCNALH